MYTLIPQKDNHKLTTDYRLRVLAVLFFSLAVSLLIGIASLAPSYILSDQDEREAVARVEEMQRDRESRGVNELDKDAEEANRLATALLGENELPVFSVLVDDIVRNRGEGIVITSFTMKALSTTTLEAIVKGKASTRDALVGYRKRVVEDTRFTKVDLPISDLAKSKDIPFTLTLSAAL